MPKRSSDAFQGFGEELYDNDSLNGGEGEEEEEEDEETSTSYTSGSEHVSNAICLMSHVCSNHTPYVCHHTQYVIRDP